MSIVAESTQGSLRRRLREYRYFANLQIQIDRSSGQGPNSESIGRASQ
jgi:hypothetical protein